MFYVAKDKTLYLWVSAGEPGYKVYNSLHLFYPYRAF